MRLALEQVRAGYLRPQTPPVSFAVARGESIGLHGPNGVGKSTLLAAIGGVAKVFSGKLWRPADWRIAWLPQNPPRFAETPYGGRELLATLRRHWPAPPPRLASVLDRRLDKLSGGEYQLLMLWATLIDTAELVLLDEPTNHLDRAHIAVAEEEIRRGRDGRAVIVVSHDQAFLRRVCDRLVQVSDDA